MEKKYYIKNLLKIVSNLKEGKDNIIMACRKIDYLYSDIDENDELFYFFRALSSDTEEYPIEEKERNNWKKEALDKLDAKYKIIMAEAREEALPICDKLIEKYSKLVESEEE